jgi:beta-glucosidase
LVQDNIRSIAVIGPDADNLSAAGGGSAYVRPTLSVSVLDGIRQRAGNSIQIKYAPGTDALGPGALLPGPVAIPSSCFSEAGVTVEYWTNPTFSGDPFLTRIEPKVELNYGLVDLIQGSTTGSPKLPVKPSNMFGRFSARFTGSLIIPKAGEYQFSLSSLGTARLYFDDRLILDTVTATSEPPLGNSHASVYSVNIMLEIGTVQVRVEYANDYSEETRFHEAMLRLGWVPPVGVVPPAIQEAVELAKRSDLTIVVARTYETEETDRPSLSLPNGQDELIRAVSAVNSKTIVVLMNASPVDVASWEANVPAILESWYAGQEQGNAVARILFGDVNPSGRLPITFPRSIVETPVSTPIQYPGIDNKVQYSEGLFVGYRGYDILRLEPQYPFGYGISYTTFEYSDLKLDKELINGDETLDVSFAITNTGQRAGVDVPQIYISLPESTAASVKRLVSWERILLQPGERKQIYIVLDPKSPEHPFSFYNADTRSWEIASGDYVIHLGASSQDIRIISPFKMQKTM